MPSTMYIPLGDYIESLWPQNILEPPPLDQINAVWIEPLKIETEPDFNMKTSILFEQELALSIPGVDGVSIVFAAAENDSAFMFEFFTNPSPGMKVVDVPIAIRFARDLLKPATLTTDSQGNQVVTPDTTRDHVDITLAKITLSASFDGGFGIEVEGGIDLPLCLIGDTGVGIEARNIRFVGANDTPPPGKPAGWTGVHIPSAGLWLPGELGSIVGHITLTDATIGNGGFSGTITDTWSPALAASIGGLELQLNSVAISFVQNCFTQCEIHAAVTLPFFDAPLDVEIGINLDGSFAIKLGSPSGLLTLTKPDILELQVQSLGFSWGDDTLTVKMSGKIRPLIGGLDWPGFEVKELSIDSHGNVKLDGGWIDLRDGYALEFHGFKVEIRRIGFGKTDDGGKWIGFSGGLNLVDGFSAGASVDGLKVTWYEDGSQDPKITIEGVGVELEIPSTLSFKGHVRYREFIDSHGDTVHQFDGDIKLKLLMIDLEVDAVLVIGSALKPNGHSYTFFGIYISVELPAGIPLWSTGVALYGLAGLFALQMEPDKHEDEAWYGVGPSDGWYKRPDIGVTDLAKKWRNEEGSLALGGGLTLGTVVDNGFTFSGRMLLVLVFPGPILMIEGKANLLKERSKLSDEPIFRALAVLDGRAGTFLFGLDAQYKVGDGGELLEIHGGVEAFFDFHDMNRWHLYMGLKEPREKRIRAHIFNLFEANTYFMIDAFKLQTGSWVGYDKTWRFGPVSITLEAWLETNVVINWKPIHFHGDLWAHGKVALKVFGFGFGLSLDAKLAGDIFDPFHILADLKVEIDLPWPLPDFDVHFSLEWGPEKVFPHIPMVLKEVAVEHLKVTTSWPLPRNSLLLPNYDHDGFIGAPAGPSVPADLSQVPVVPLDCRPHITFGRGVHDAALIGNNPQPPNPAEERIGNPENNEGPAKVKYTLRAVTLEKHTGGGSWAMVARKGDTPNPAGVPELFGSWAPIPAAFGGSATQAVGQVKLWLWSKTAFDYTRATSGAWDEWFTDQYPSYPCIPDAPSKHICCNFTRYAIGAQVDFPHICDPDMVLFCYPPNRVHVERVNPPVEGIDRAACFLPESLLQIAFKRPARHVDILVLSDNTPVTTCVDFTDHRIGRDVNPLEWLGLKFTVFNAAGAPSSATQFKDMGGARSLDAGFQTLIDLPSPTNQVAVTLFWQAPGTRLEALDASGTVVDSDSVSGEPPETIVLQGSGIVRVRTVSPNNETFIQRVCYQTNSGQSSVEAVATFTNGTISAPYHPTNDHIVIDHEDISAVTVRGKRGKFCVVRVCADLGPDPQDVLERQEMAQHLLDATAQWSQEGAVLEPNTTYRLKILTKAEATGEAELAGMSDTREQEETAFFRTEGPPGLTKLDVPVNTPNPDQFDSGLDDLIRYVKQTVPSTVPPPGQKALLPKPVYRAYDVGVEFNEDYVDLMYRISGRDLGLYLFDNNNLPVRDAAGKLIVMPNRWGKVETTTLDASEERWIQVVNKSTCALIGVANIPKDVKLDSGAPGQVLAPDAVHEARLMPLLLHESFAKFTLGATVNGPSGTLGRWQVVDQGTTSGPSHWEIAETPAPVTRFIRQTTNIYGGTTDGIDPIKPGTMLIWGADPNLGGTDPDQPHNWTDYRLTAYLRNEDDDAIGLVFRYVDANNYYRFSMDAERKYRRLTRVVAGVHTILAEDDRQFQKNVDYAVTVEAIGSSLKVYIDGDPILEADDPSHAAGSIGLYSWASERARFFDIMVDDFRKADPATKRPSPVYRFQFTTSKFAHFTHHVHSFDDKTWVNTLDPGATTAAWVGAANLPNAAISDAETRAYDALSHAVLESAADSFPDGVEVTRVEQNGNTVGFLAQTSEPFDWTRLNFEVLSAPKSTHVQAVAPDALKLVSTSFATSVPKEEAITLVTRDSLDLRGHAIETFLVPGPLKGSATGESFYEDFNQDGLGVLFQETFGPNALDRYKIVDQGDSQAPSAWSVSGGAIRQTSNIWGGVLAASALPKPGTMAITGDAEWGSVRIKARMLSTDNDSIGIVFRYKDANNYYRFSTDQERSYRRLVKCIDGVFTLLWEDTNHSYSVGMAFDLQIDAFGNHLVGQMNNVVLFDLTDDDLKLGQVGLYCWANIGANFQSLRVEALDRDPVLYRPDMTKLDGWNVSDTVTGAVDGPSTWSAGADGITQGSKIRVVGTEKFGTHLLSGQVWDDAQLSLDLVSSEGGAMGVLIRHRDPKNYYRFSMHNDESYFRFDKCVNGVVTTLFQTLTGFTLGRDYRLTITAKGNEFRGYLDGEILFIVQDDDISEGCIGLYTWNNGGVTFSNLWVLSLATYVGAFSVQDGAGLSGVSTWRTRHGELQQRSAIGNAAAPNLGTHAVAPVVAPKDMRLTVEARSDSDRPIGVLFRYQDERNYYRLSVSTADHVRRLIKMVNGVATTLWQTAGGYSPGNGHLFTVDTFGDRLIGYFDGVKLFEVTDNSLPTGKVGVYASMCDTAAFGSVQIGTPPIEALALFNDKFAENDTSDWTFVSEATIGGPAAWSTVDGTLRQTSGAYSPPIPVLNITKKGLFAVTGSPAWGDVVFRARLQSSDSHAIGIMFRYQDQNHYYRFSMDRLQKYRRLVKNVGGTFTALWQDNFIFELGHSYEVVIVAVGNQLWGYFDGVPMFAVEDSSLATGQVGLYCWRNPGAKFSCVSVLPAEAAFTDWAFQDDFPYLVVDRWAFVDVGATDAPSKWSVANERLIQESAISGDQPRKGTFAVSEKESRNWPDYRFVAKASSSTDGTMGIAARYRDPENHYRFELTRLPLKRRLVKIVNGVETELWSDSKGYQKNFPYLLAIDCIGQRITCYVNGIQVCEVVDSDLTSGRIALFTFANTGAAFDFVRVQEAAWLSYYRFGKQPKVPAGQRIRVLACAEAAAPAPLTNTRDYFVAGPGENGSFHFFRSSCDLRIVDPQGRVQHTRTFLRSSRYTAVAGFRLLRRPDGCGFFLALPAGVSEGTRFPEAEYRLKLTYRRDNTAVDAASQVLREASASDAEVTQIDLPW